jgi:prepilin-type N-terminal cleavage/methylation domain-containing protein
MNTAPYLNLKKGFTLIELLIVIALLGALAMGLLAAIDPVEQIRKGRDTTLRNTGANFFNAELRYYAVKGQFTWGTTATSGNVNALAGDVSSLMNAGELKTNYIAQAGTTNLAKLLLTSTSAQDVAVCFKPESKGFQADPVTIYGSDGVASAATCKSQTSSGGTDCYMCFR